MPVAVAQPAQKQPLTPAQYAELQARNQEVQQHLAFVQSVCDMLGETKPHVHWRIHLIIRVLGCARVVELLRETLRIEQTGGMLIKNGSRRRTPGGVFFHITKTKYGHLLPPSVMEPPKFTQRKQRKMAA